MAIPVQINFKDVDPSPAVEERIRERVARLEKFADRATGLDVIVAAPHRSSHKGRLFQFTLELRLPGKDVVVKQADTPNHAHEDVYVALRDAFDALERRAKDEFARRGR